ncbi:MAG TPA: cob(I)yrinic acid a,c-diamide adenosyltransferase [Candidatus Magasanikbacteria bacterium]|jgi:cob(I)alamin adenosyltransferase|nr:cob(I)yrinic acid a,c-diamide adenosyltransferase [Candidatus Magasanikbacteria bacterium]HQF57521.1 cob(I)yrinic acid a,c-diamide adenosyltransferase [Candidatus Magasanikbacteria bacterium]
MVKIYTKFGDQGKTSMLNGKRVDKCCLEIEAIGEVDELNAFLGILIEIIEEDFKLEKKKLFSIQNDLLIIGANLADLQADCKNIPKLTNFKISKLEKWIDQMEKELPKLKNFILPGGSEESAMAFYARAICRRVERVVISLDQKYVVPIAIKKYLNRLSDLLFVFGRWLNMKKGAEELKWKKS